MDDSGWEHATKLLSLYHHTHTHSLSSVAVATCTLRVTPHLSLHTGKSRGYTCHIHRGWHGRAFIKGTNDAQTAHKRTTAVTLTHTHTHTCLFNWTAPVLQLRNHMGRHSLSTISGSHQGLLFLFYTLCSVLPNVSVLNAVNNFTWKQTFCFCQSVVIPQWS